jgi:dihydroflavonol-4-reductase
VTALVAAGSGYLSRAVVRALVADGEEVRVLARRPEAGASLRRRGVEFLPGHLLDRGSVRAALAGCDTLYLLPSYAPDPRPFWLLWPLATRAALQAAAAAGVAKVVFTSSWRAIGARRGEVGNEATPYRRRPLSGYERSQVAAERCALAAATAGLPVVVVNPAVPYGPGDPCGTRRLVAALAGRPPVAFGGTLSWVDVDDAGRGHVLAARRGRVGTRYVLSERVAAVDEVLALACRLAGRRPPVSLPDALAAAVGAAGEAAARLARRSVRYDWAWYRELAHGVRLDGSRAARELGLAYTPLEDGMERTLAWLRARGLVADRPPVSAGGGASGRAR